MSRRPCAHNARGGLGEVALPVRPVCEPSSTPWIQKQSFRVVPSCEGFARKCYKPDWPQRGAEVAKTSQSLCASCASLRLFCCLGLVAAQPRPVHPRFVRPLTADLGSPPSASRPPRPQPGLVDEAIRSPRSAGPKHGSGGDQPQGTSKDSPLGESHQRFTLPPVTPLAAARPRQPGCIRNPVPHGRPGGGAVPLLGHASTARGTISHGVPGAGTALSGKFT